MRLILIRHGMTSANEKHLYCGSTDISLSEKGAADLKDLKDEGIYPDISGMEVVTSGMKRCEETLDILYGDVPHIREPLLREMDFGAFEMRSYDEMKTDPLYINWISGDNEKNLTPDGESGEIMRNRVLKALSLIVESGKDTAVITHGGVIAAVMAELFREEGKNRYMWQPAYGRGYNVDTEEMTYVPI